MKRKEQRRKHKEEKEGQWWQPWMEDEKREEKLRK